MFKYIAAIAISFLFTISGRSEDFVLEHPPVKSPGLSETLLRPHTVFMALLQYPDGVSSWSRSQAVQALSDTCTYFWNTSYQQATIIPTVSDEWLMMPHPEAYYEYNRMRISEDARAVAYAAGYGDLWAYDHIVYLFPPTRGMGSSGYTVNREMFLDDALYILPHEMGHSYGWLKHSHRWIPCDITNPVDSCGYYLEYGDCFDQMGSGNSLTQDFNVFEKNLMGWLGPNQIIQVVANGIYRIHRYDNSAAGAFTPLAVTFPKPNTTMSYWLSYRATDTNLRTGLTVMWADQSQWQDWLIDFHPATYNCNWDVAVPVGQTLNDGGIQITPIAVGGTDPDFWIDVDVELPAQSPTPTATATPTVTPTATATATATATPTATETPISTPTVSPTATPPSTPSPTPTALPLRHRRLRLLRVVLPK